MCTVISSMKRGSLFLTSLETFSLTQGFHRNVLLDFQVLGGFPVIFMSLISSLILLWSGHTLYDLNSFNLLKCGVVYLGERSLCP